MICLEDAEIFDFLLGVVRVFRPDLNAKDVVHGVKYVQLSIYKVKEVMRYDEINYNFPMQSQVCFCLRSDSKN